MAGVVWFYCMDWPIGYFKFILQTLVVAVLIGTIQRCTGFNKLILLNCIVNVCCIRVHLALVHLGPNGKVGNPYVLFPISRPV